ncbi:hypothetical protein LTR37_005803 [Vermiconidia calcicola]|uniref:Uncharacterized protein n=1 Tax=Vermiconidia calcicola TaxID=1690605 RepID=A0ACC3NIC1_9PEZI|nr:hypothetical protein LTR37_005803 [Vermiconidia calcicola]
MALSSRFYNSLLYVVLSTSLNTWTTAYHQYLELTGLYYVAGTLRGIAGALTGSPLMDYVSEEQKGQADGAMEPEYHLPLMLPGAIKGPIGVFLYGWIAHSKIHWAVVDSGVFLFYFRKQITGQPIHACHRCKRFNSFAV